jgi:GNAT superfamily N-acetyltransferase
VSESFRLDVFGRVIEVERRGEEWRLYDVGAEGKRSPLREVAVPATLTAQEVERYLADLFHEHASSRHPDVKRIPSRRMHRIRAATLDDKPELEALIARSARELSRDDYSPEQIEGALRGAFGVDTQLIADGTYFVVIADNRIVGCGGWSKRRTLFGSDARAGRDAGELEPTVDAAKIRAFFVDPAYARRGIGRAVLEHCEAAARAHGFKRFELMATLPGVRLYREHGYVGDERIEYEVSPGLTIPFVPMTKG